MLYGKASYLMGKLFKVIRASGRRQIEVDRVSC